MSLASISFTSSSLPTATRLVTGVHHNDIGLPLVDVPVHRHQVRFQAMGRRPLRVDPQQTSAHPRLEVDADGPHVPGDLVHRLLEREIEAALPPPACRVRKMRGQAGLAGPRGPRHEDTIATKVSFVPEASRPTPRPRRDVARWDAG